MEYEDRIQRIRLEEASKKEYFGPTSKFIFVVKLLGSEIVQDNFPSESISSFYEDLYISENKVNEFSEDHTSSIIGYQYDGLRLGLPIEIIYKESMSNIKVFWKNRIVYEETDGVLERFIPLNEWETEIEKFYKKAQAKLKIMKEKQEKAAGMVKSPDNAEIMRIREKWGIV